LYNKQNITLDIRIIIMEEPDKLMMDVGALGITAGALFEILPSITALASLVWVCIRIYETDTVQNLLGK
jgi:hypothetical protein